MTAKTLAATILGLGLVWGTGCDKAAAPTVPAKADDKKKDDKHGVHEHGTGPHGGVIFDLGKWHAEFKPNHEKKEATVWILGMDEKTPAPVKAEKLRLVVANAKPKIEIDLLPTEKGADGAAHTFTGKHDGFGVEMEYKGTVSFQIGEKPYTGDFEEETEKKDKK